MHYVFTAVKAPTHLHAVATGELTAENMRRFLVDAHRAAVGRNYDSLLVESRFSGRSLELSSIYSVIEERSPDGSIFKRIAYVDNNPDQLPDRAEFAQVAASRLGVNVRLFRTVSEAEQWLSRGNDF